jgi:hypothetical protein
MTSKEMNQVCNKNFCNVYCIALGVSEVGTGTPLSKD